MRTTILVVLAAALHPIFAAPVSQVTNVCDRLLAPQGALLRRITGSGSTTGTSSSSSDALEVLIGVPPSSVDASCLDNLTVQATSFCDQLLAPQGALMRRIGTGATSTTTTTTTTSSSSSSSHNSPCKAKQCPAGEPWTLLSSSVAWSACFCLDTTSNTVQAT